MNFERSFITEILKRFDACKSLGDKTLEQLSEADLNVTPNEASNSIAVIVQHMYGNMMSRFTNFLTEDGEKSWRNRDAEFESMGMTKQDILDCWETGWSNVLQAINQLEENDLMKEVTIRSEKLLVHDALLRQLAHYATHIGQMMYIGKMIKNNEWKSLSIPKGASASYNQQMSEGK